MLAKTICMMISGITYYRMNLPPKAGMDVSKTEDKFGRDGNYRVFYLIFATQFAPVEAILFPVAYVYLMARGALSPDLEPWMAIAVVLQWMGYALRLRAYTELDRYFTYAITIRRDHQLVVTGPYKYLRHPSYTGFMVAGILFHMITVYGGLWEAVIYPMVGMHLPGYVALSVFTIFYGMFVFPRIHYEEAMLSEHFGEKAWGKYASQRYRLFPFVY
ncbi:hypothetical protein DFQ27_004147 [Actinomortierella ambigua]|uniref:Protein-S-isoprenylcysteine O-methyltransferase n=1 Tax=Actinomortierella ambigua TaxID=1343610 RepID=A0A9P6QMI8_9FUNG|nr:hypothetical protein DFQ27_004147 [Actinomortierella ambigua]